MRKMQVAIAAIALSLLGSYYLVHAQQVSPMTFFVSSVGSGNGGNLGGLTGADKHCQTLAAAAGAGNRTWRAYLSASASSGQPAVNARDRIGKGPWQNVKGVVIAKSVEDLHTDKNNLTKETALSEKGEMVNGRGDKPNKHDILTGSTMDGRLAGEMLTCNNWTSSANDAMAQLGHHDRQGLSDTVEAKSWNSSHPSKGCNQEALRGTGGDGLIYCFATN